MRKIILFGVLMGFLASPVKAEETITLVADEWCPYNCAPNGEKKGFMVEIATQAFAKHGIKVSYKTLPWSRAINDVRNLKYTAIIGSSYDDAPDFIFPKLSQGKIRNAFFVEKDSKWKYTGKDSLKTISLGVIADYSYNEEIDAYIKENAKNPRLVQIVAGDKALNNNVLKLLEGRIHALLEDESVMNNYLSDFTEASSIRIAGYLPETRSDNIYIAFSPKEPKAKEYAEILATETKKMRKNGELKKILVRYGVLDWQ